ncbi:hypothetical protein [Streptomyces sp. NPDC086023]|uniref:hypothetical protein n=1 Tax=Streptomyces sp. NPDC086023 TaxID=3365746 RepID=UPI0037D05BDD
MAASSEASSKWALVSPPSYVYDAPNGNKISAGMIEGRFVADKWDDTKTWAHITDGSNTGWVKAAPA